MGRRRGAAFGRHIDNGFVALGPNVTGYPGGYPNGYLEFLRRKGWWGHDRLHLCSGSVQDGITVDIYYDFDKVRPTVVCDLQVGVPFKDESFDAVIIDPPYSERLAQDLYSLPLLNVKNLLQEAERVCRPDGWVIMLDITVWPEQLFGARKLVRSALYAMYVANRGPNPLRAIQVWRKLPRPLSRWDSGSLK